MIETKDVRVSFSGNEILKGISIRAGEGQIISLIGASGCGKSTLLRSIMGLIPVSGGEIYIAGERVDNLRESRLNEVRKQMGMVFQEGALFDSMNVRDNVAFALRRHTRMKEKEIRKVVAERLDAVGLTGVEDRNPSQLSGGMRRRVGIARALALSPKILLYDEPTTGLDPLLTATVADLILKMRDRYGTTSIVVTHDMLVTRHISDRIYMLFKGHILLEGTHETFTASRHPDVFGFLNAMQPDLLEKEDTN